jgi:beta-glucosidase
MNALPRKAIPVAGSGFPQGFIWGAATASYQIEGAVHEDGRGESIWDRFAHTPGRVVGGDTGDVACDHYHRFRDDVGLMAELGLAGYRFSVAWPRVMPTGRGAVNEAGLDFYDRLVDRLRECGIGPHLTLYHWDLPQVLEDAGGWPERSTAEAFADYAAVVARRVGDRVASISTFNEPFCISHLGYRVGIHAPGRMDHAAALAAGHHVLVAHGLAMQAIRAAAPGAPAGIVLNFESLEPATPDPLDAEATAVAHDQMNGWFLDPVVGRDYPAAGLADWGWDRAEVCPGDMALIATPIDFMGVNYYTGRKVRSPALPPLDPLAAEPAPERTGLGWDVYPEGLTKVLRFVASRTGELPLYVTENGAAYPDDPTDPTRDPKRVCYLERHVEAVCQAIAAGVPVRGFFVWSLFDNFEWAEGYGPRFGIVHVDFETQERRIRDSGRYWSSLARSAAAP